MLFLIMILTHKYNYSYNIVHKQIKYLTLYAPRGRTTMFFKDVPQKSVEKDLKPVEPAKSSRPKAQLPTMFVPAEQPIKSLARAIKEKFGLNH